MICEVLIKNAEILTMDEEMPKASWLAINNGRLAALGNNRDMPRAEKLYDMKGKCILPGFIDSHVHGTLTGEYLSSADLDRAKTIDEVLEKISNQSNTNGSVITAGCFSKEGYTGKLFTAEDLDLISKEKPIIVYDKSYHGCYLNNQAIKAAGITPEMPGVVTKCGRMTGEVNDDISYYAAVHNIMSQVDETVIKEYMHTVNDFALSRGVTTIHSLDGGDYGVDMPAWIVNRHLLDLQVVNYWETLDFEKVRPYKLSRIGGCICLDGTRTLHTMALIKPYADKPDTRGLLYYNDAQILEFIRKANNNNMQCSLHAAGTRAIDQYIYLLNQVIKECGQKNLRHRIEHFSYPTDEQIQMAAELELALPMQPIFTKVWDDGEDSMYKKRFGTSEAAKIEPIADIIKAGGMVCGGSDSPVTMIDPLAGIDACVNTDNPHRKITTKEALELYTKNGAWAAHEDKDKGTLACGKNADLVVLDRNPFDAAGRIKEIQVEQTFVKGELVYQREK